MSAVEEKKNGATKPAAEKVDNADGDKPKRQRNRRRGGNKEGEKGETENGGRSNEKPAEKKDAAAKEGEDGEKKKRQRNRRRGPKKTEGEEGEKKPAENKAEAGEKKSDDEKPKRSRNRRRRGAKPEGEEGEEKKGKTSEKTEGDGEAKPKRRRDRRKRAGLSEKAGVTADMDEEQVKALPAVRVANYPHFLSHKDSAVYFRSCAPLLPEGMQLSYEMLSEEEVKALGAPATKKEDAEPKTEGGRQNNRRELAYKDRFDYWTSPEGAVKYRLVYLFPTTPGTVDELVKKLSTAKSLEFDASDRLKEIPQFKSTEEKSTVELPRALEAKRITWADIPSYVQKPTAKPE